MGSTDRAVRRASRHLGAQEALVASAVGREVDGRRCQVVLLTDRRIIVAGLRSEPPSELDLGVCVASFDAVGGLLSIVQGDQEMMVRQIEPGAAGRIITHLATRRRQRAADPTSMGHVRVLPA